MAKKGNATQIAKMFGVHISTVLDWVKRGCPYDSKETMKKKTRWVFDVEDVKTWRESDVSLRKSKPRHNLLNQISISSSSEIGEVEARFRRLLGF